MADIRQNTAYLDDFLRANEHPLSHGGDWGITDSAMSATQLDLKTFNATHSSSGSISDSAWGPLALDGNDAEAWGKQAGGGALGIAWGIGLMSSVGGSGAADGYRFRLEIAVQSYWRLYRVDNSARTQIASAGPGVDAAYVNGFGHLLLRRNGTSVEGWITTDTITWTKIVSAVDNTYTTGLHPTFGITDNSGGQILAWDYVGGGGRIRRTQFFRRPSN